MVQSGLVGWWPLHEWGGQANDLSGNDNHGTVNGATQGVAGIGGLTAYSFDGSNDAVGLPSTGLSGDTWSFSAWTYVNGVNSSDNEYLFHHENGTVFVISSRNNSTYSEVSVYDGTNTHNSTVSWDVNEWQHITVVSNGNQLLIYKNGNLGDTFSYSFNTATAENAIGAQRQSGPAHWNGVVSDARLYNRALSPREVTHLYEVGSLDLASPPGAADSSAVSRWAFDDRSDTSTALDGWGSNDATIDGAVYSNNSPRNEKLAMSFDGSNDTLSFASSSELDTAIDNQNYTISVWFRSEPTSAERTFHRFDTGTARSLAYVNWNDNSGLRWYESTTGNSHELTDRVYDDGNWHHVVFDTDGTNSRIYTDGVLRLEESAYNPSSSSEQTFYIGSNGGSSDWWDGELADFRIYGRTLDPSEVYQLYRWGSPGVDLRSEVVTR